MSVDPVWYTRFYHDLRHLSPLAARLHYQRHGKGEGRVGSAAAMNRYQEALSRRIQLESLGPFQVSNTEHRIYVLIRTSRRPNYFGQCMASILCQTHTNLKIWISYDDIEAYEYIRPWILMYPEQIAAFYVSKNMESSSSYWYELYCNDLLDHVPDEDAWIVFLDDDDIFTHSNALTFVNAHLNDTSTIVLWNFARPDRLVCPKKAPEVAFGSIDTTCVCFPVRYKNCARWIDRAGSDHFFFSELFRQTQGEARLVYVDRVLTRAIYTAHACGNGVRGEVETHK